jgi:hypothetical protein
VAISFLGWLWQYFLYKPIHGEYGEENTLVSEGGTRDTRAAMFDFFGSLRSVHHDRGGAPDISGLTW